MECGSVTQRVLIDNDVLAVFVSGRKYDVIPQNVCTLVFRNKVPYQNAASLQNVG
jgi:ABC-type spermidine/putrescine transport system permease subunit II